MCGATLFVRVGVFAHVSRPEKPRQPQADIWLTCPADPLGLFVGWSLWESVWQRLLPPLSGCDCFVTKDDSQRDGLTRVCAAPIVYAN